MELTSDTWKEIQRLSRTLQKLIQEVNEGNSEKSKQLTRAQQESKEISERVRAQYVKDSLAGKEYDEIINELSDKFEKSDDQIENYLRAKGNKFSVGQKPLPRTSTIKKLQKSGRMAKWMLDLGNVR